MQTAVNDHASHYVPDRPAIPAQLQDIQAVLRSFVTMGTRVVEEISRGTLTVVRQRAALQYLATHWVVPRKDQQEAANRIRRSDADIEIIRYLNPAAHHWVERAQAELDAAVAANNHAMVDPRWGHADENNPNGLHTSVRDLNLLIDNWNEVYEIWPIAADRQFIDRHADVLRPAPDSEHVYSACLPPWLQDVTRRGPGGGPPPPPPGGSAGAATGAGGMGGIGVSASELGPPKTASARVAYDDADDRTRARYFEYGTPMNHNVNMRRFDFPDKSCCVVSAHIPQTTQDFFGYPAVWQGYTLAYYLNDTDVPFSRTWKLSYIYGWKQSPDRLTPVPLPDLPKDIADCYNFATRSDLFEWYPWKSGNVDPREPRFDHCGRSVERVDPIPNITETTLERPPTNSETTHSRVKRALRAEAQTGNSGGVSGLVQAIASFAAPAHLGQNLGQNLDDLQWTALSPQHGTSHTLRLT